MTAIPHQEKIDGIQCKRTGHAFYFTASQTALLNLGIYPILCPCCRELKIPPLRPDLKRYMEGGC